MFLGVGHCSCRAFLLVLMMMYMIIESLKEVLRCCDVETVRERGMPRAEYWSMVVHSIPTVEPLSLVVVHSIRRTLSSVLVIPAVRLSSVLVISTVKLFRR